MALRRNTIWEVKLGSGQCSGLEICKPGFSFWPCTRKLCEFGHFAILIYKVKIQMNCLIPLYFPSPSAGISV